MRYASFVLLICSALMLGGCSAALGVRSTAITGSGNLITQDFDFTGFETVDAGSNFKVTVRRGDAFSVKVTSDDNVADILKVTSGRGKLTLGVKPGAYSMNNVTMKAEVTLPALTTVIGRANAVVTFERFVPGRFTLNLSGNAIVEGEIHTGKLDLDADGNGQARVRGVADSVNLRGKGNAILTLGELAAKQANVDLNNNAMATVQASQSLDYTLNGNAGLAYSGGAQLGKQQARGNSWARSGE
jgi:hypothetical protein